MPRDLFGDVTRPSISIGNRKWYTVPVSLLSHSAIVFALVVIPLLARDVLPKPWRTDRRGHHPPVRRHRRPAARADSSRATCAADGPEHCADKCTDGIAPEPPEPVGGAARVEPGRGRSR